MRCIFLFLFALFIVPVSYGQDGEVEDTDYLEDQIYISLSYDILLKKPESISQNGFSGGFSIGFIRDIPLNERRNFGVAVGLGYAYDAFIQNMKISKEESTLFEAVSDYNSNSLRLHYLELPFEIRWRNSSPSKYKFWRAYAGLKLGYLVTGKSKFSDSNGAVLLDEIPELETFQVGLYLAAGYSTWNIYVYSGLKELFSDADLNENPINMKPFKIGLKFYIL